MSVVPATAAGNGITVTNAPPVASNECVVIGDELELAFQPSGRANFRYWSLACGAFGFGIVCIDTLSSVPVATSNIITIRIRLTMKIPSLL